MTKHGVTRQMLSESIHVSLAAVYRIMDGTRKPSASHLNRLVQYFSVLENNPNTEQELEKVFDVFFAWYVFDMWYTQHRDMYMYVQDKKKVDKVLPSQVSSLGKVLGGIGKFILYIPNASKKGKLQ